MYKILRNYANGSIQKEVVATGLTLAEAQKHCQSSETHSSTCTTDEGVARTKKFGDWFDGYEEVR